MQIQSVNSLLTPAGLGPPTLRALIPNVDNYTVLLLQPEGHIEASPAGVRHQDRALAHSQFRGFLNDARTNNVALAVTPEYSMPWETLSEALQTGCTPSDGSLWALGCESIRYTELEALKQTLAPHATVLFEALQADDHRFVDPLAYVFVAPPTKPSGASRVVLLVQFKTCPMGDDGHFEVNGMQRGTRVYQFGGDSGNPRLLSLICSDAFEFLDPEAAQVYDRALVLHIQLNRQPRQHQYRQYRDRLFRFRGGATEILCLNWAKDVREACGGATHCWNNISGSAWYLPDTFDEPDTTLSLNHRNGLYYTWFQAMRSHAMFFNYEPAAYFVTASKVVHRGVTASLSRRRGPQLTAMHTWDNHASAWVHHPGPTDGFATVVAESGNAQHDIAHLADVNPFNAERVLALCAGSIGTNANWYHLRQLDSCGIETSEVIRRMTFCQDNDHSAQTFRVRRLRRCRRLWDILNTPDHLPPALDDLKNGFRLDWAPHQNVISSAGRRATAIYMGEDASDVEIESVGKRMAEYLHRASPDPDAAIEARQRLHLWYRQDDGALRLFDRSRYLRIDEPRSASEFDIARTF
ncbi:MAG: hypothetical protein AMXMBFR77_17030 [Phycisphaerales bacterium]|nr:hypothetical protein [Synechococcales cyanobacterium CNB]